ncbi:hypothetical protein [Microbacterium sp. BK668]|uniref:hypothetical protein n=1 Tax=Microbacterium sp. BK668 TaxID=2512118 RepID=UPI00105E30C4|nr:hypothetical protein [Microbacterium sp. BK668]TDN92121.1 hypothetical protein EV279_1634 [Microbacterium sp. BK668]
MRLEPLYRLRFTYPHGWAVGLEGGWQQHFYLADGRCEGEISGRFRGANFPLRRTEDGPFLPLLHGVIETDDEGTVLFECRGYGRAYPAGRRQIVGYVFHVSDYPRYQRLNDTVCACLGEVRAATDPGDSPELVLDVAELIWEPIAP